MKLGTLHPDDRLVGLDVVGEYLGITTKRAWELARDKKLPGARFVLGRWKVPIRDLIALQRGDAA